MPHVGKLLQHVGIGAGTGLGLLQDRHPFLLEQHLGQLAGGVDVEFHAGDLAYLALEPSEVFAQLPGQLGKERQVDSDPFPLHVHQHRHQRHLHLGQEPLHPGGGELVRHRIAQLQHGGAVGSAVGSGACYRHLGKSDLGLPLPHQFLIRGHPGAEVLQRQRVDGVGALARIDHEARQHRVVGDSRDLDP